MPENEDVKNVFMLSRHQCVTEDQGVAVDINILAVDKAMDLFEVTDRLTCMNRVRHLWHETRKKK